MNVICPTCDGTCEVHSHNPKCPDCIGGKVSEEKAKEIKRAVELIHQLIPNHTNDYV